MQSRTSPQIAIRFAGDMPSNGPLPPNRSYPWNSNSGSVQTSGQ